MTLSPEYESRRRRWRYMKHALRMNENTLSSQTRKLMPTGERKRRRSINDLEKNGTIRHAELQNHCDQPWKTALKTGLDGEHLSLPYVPDGTGIE